MEAARANQLEGVVAKLRRSRYEPGRRTPAWLKLKVRPEQELVVGGWTPGEGNARDLGAVAVGVYEDGKLRFAGKVGSGFTATTRKRLLAAMEPLATEAPPFDPPPPRDWRGRWGGDLNGITWIRPELVIRAELGGWTRDGHVRQTSFKGVEAGRDPRSVVREEAVSSARAVADAEAEVPPWMPAGGRAARGALEPDASLGEDPRRSRSTGPADPGDDSAMPKGSTEESAPPRRSDRGPGRAAVDGVGRRAGTRWRRCRPRASGTSAASAARTSSSRTSTRSCSRRSRRPGRPAGHEARSRPLLRPDRAGDAAASRGAAAQPPSLPERRRRPGLLAEGHPRHRAVVDPPLEGGRGRGAQGQPPRHRRPGRDPLLARQPGRVRGPRLDVAARASRSRRRSP